MADLPEGFRYKITYSMIGPYRISLQKKSRLFWKTLDSIIPMTKIEDMDAELEWAKDYLWTGYQNMIARDKYVNKLPRYTDH